MILITLEFLITRNQTDPNTDSELPETLPL